MATWMAFSGLHGWHMHNGSLVVYNIYIYMEEILHQFLSYSSFYFGFGLPEYDIHVTV